MCEQRAGDGDAQSLITLQRDAALIMPENLPGTQPVSVGGDKGFDTRVVKKFGVGRHVAENHARPGESAIDGRTTQDMPSAKERENGSKNALAG